MTKLDELTEGLGFNCPITEFPEFFNEERQAHLSQFFEKWSLLCHQHKSIDSALELLTNNEIKGFALWRAIVHFSTYESQVLDLESKIFEAMYSRFSRYYLNKAGRQNNV